MDEATGKSASEVYDAASVIAAPNEPLGKGKREAEDAIEKEGVSAKKQKVEEEKSEVKNDEELVEEKVENSELGTSESKQQIKVMVCAMEGHVGLVSGDGSCGLEEDASAAKTKPAVTAEGGHVTASRKRDKPSDDSYSFSENQTDTVVDVAATNKALASLTKEGPIPAKKTDGSSLEDETNADHDIAAAQEAHTTPSTKESRVSELKKDESESDDWTISHVNASMVEKTPAAPAQMGPSNATNPKKKDDESLYEDDITTRNISAPVTSKKDQSIEESESDDKLNNDPNTTVAPNEKTCPKTLYVGNLSFSVEQEDVEHFFEAAGEIVGIRFGMNPDESFRGFGFVEFSSAEAAEKALHELNGKELLRRPVKLDLVKERGSNTPYSGKSQSFQKGETAQGHRIFVRGFNKFDGEDKIRSSLKDHFGSCGEITRVSLPTDQYGAAKGIAFIFFKDSDACNRALELNGSVFKGSTLLVEDARSRHDSRDSGGGNGDGRGWRSDGAIGGRNGGWDSTLVEKVKPRHDSHDSGGSISDRGWKSGGPDVGGRRGGWASSLSVEEARPRHESRDTGDQGWRSGGWDIGGRSGGWDIGGRSGGWDIGGRSGGWDSTLSAEEVRPSHDSHDSGGSIGGQGWRSGGSVGGRSGGGDSTFSVEQARPRHDSRDSGGSGSGHGWGSGGWDIGGRSHEVGGRTIFVRGFNKVDGEDKIRNSLKEHFGSCGEITRVSLPKDQDGTVKGISFVFFKDSDACSRALELNGSEFGGSTLLVEEARSRHDNRDSGGNGGGRGWPDWVGGGRIGGWDSTLSVEETRPRHDSRDSGGGVSDRGWTSGAWDLGGRTCGWGSTLSVVDTRPRHDTHDSGGNGSGHGLRCGGLNIGGKTHEVGSGGKRIFVRGFNKFDGEDKIRSSLEEHFGSCGEITRVSLPKVQDGAVKGIAFIFFKDSDACSRALELNGSEFGGSTLLVEEARSRHDSRDIGANGSGRGWTSDGVGGGRNGGRDSTFSVEGTSAGHDSHNSGGGVSDRGWTSGAWDVGGRTCGWRSTLPLVDTRPRHDTRDSGGSGSGHGLRCGGLNIGGKSHEVGSGGRRIFVRGFNKFDGEDKIRSSLEEHFGSCGEITRVSLPKDQDGAVKGIAFIFFKDSDACSRALELNRSEFGGSTLLVEEARSGYDIRDSGGSDGSHGWRNGVWDFRGRSDGAGILGRSGGWHSTFSVEETRPRYDNHDNGGSVRVQGCRSGGWNVGGRSGGRDFGGRSGGRDFGGRSGGWDVGGRSGGQGFGGRSGGRGGWFCSGGRSWVGGGGRGRGTPC